MPTKKPAEDVKVTCHAWNTSTLMQKIEDDTESVRGRGSAGYNPDWDPPQNSVLKSSNTNIDSPRFRQKLVRNSAYLRTHTQDLLLEIVRRGWTYTKKAANIHRLMKNFKPVYTDDIKPYEDPANIYEGEDWEPELKLAFIEATTKAAIIDTAYITRFMGKTDYYGNAAKTFYRIFTRNDVYRKYGDEDYHIEEIYFRMPRPSDLYIRDKPQSTIHEMIVGFLTQYAVNNELPTHEWVSQRKGMKEKTISRNCVQIQPYPSIYEVFGEPLLQIENQTALEKICLRAYEFALLENGGVKKTIGLSASLAADSKDVLVAETKRGIKSRGTVLELNGGKNVGDVLMVQETAIPDLPFDIVNSHLSEDAQLSKQGVEGAAQTGALGGQAPKENASADETALLNLHPYLEKIIKDINDVYYEMNPADYDVYFLPPSSAPMMNMSSQEAEAEALANGTNEFQAPALESEVATHSVRDKFVQFKGHMLPAGTYLYPDRPERPSDVFTPDEVKEMCSRNVRDGYLELDHSDDPNRVAIAEGIGFFHIDGFDEIRHWDDTSFFIKEDVYHSVLHSPQRIKVSPRLSFIRDNEGKKHLVAQNCAVIISGIDRASLSGLDASAQKVK